MVSGAVLTAANLNTIGAAWETWTPALTASTTNPTLGTGSTASGRYGRINKTVFGQLLIQFGTSGVAAGTGFYFVSLPVTAQASGPTVGSGYILDNSTSLLRHVVAVLDTTGRMALWLENTTSFAVGAGNPWAWAASDSIRVDFEYEAA
jgi:hypothetical protein